MPASTTLLIVDDDAHIRDVLRYALENEGFTVLEAADGKQGLALALSQNPQLLILDVMMPEMNGLDLCRELRKTSKIPILFLSSRDSELDTVLGLEFGGDDYVSKPFSPRELLARVKAMLRRHAYASEPSYNNPAADSKELQHGDLTLSSETYRVFWKEHPLTLTTTEFNLLHTFMLSPQRCFSREALCQLDIFRDVVSDRTIDSHIRRLRAKFSILNCNTVIETMHGFGYQLGSCL